MVNMVASVDGGATVSGRSAALGGAPDRAAFSTIRTVPDVILVGAGTVRAERYGPPRASHEVQAQRRARGQAALPRLAIVSGRLDLDATSAVFTEATEPPFVLTAGAGRPDRRRDLDDIAEVWELASATGQLDLRAALERLAGAGVRTVLCEGGPSINAQLVADDLVDEWCLTLAPTALGGDAPRIVHGPGSSAAHDLQLAHVLEDAGVLLLRYERAAPP